MTTSNSASVLLKFVLRNVSPGSPASASKPSRKHCREDKSGMTAAQ